MTTTTDPSGAAARPRYADGVNLYLAAGWAGVLPLPTGAKAPPPTGMTGAGGRDPNPDEIETWRTGPAWAAGNLCLRLPKDVVGIDVDAYGDKAGDEELDRLIEEHDLPPLPPTWTSSARPFPSGIRFYRLPEGVDESQCKAALCAWVDVVRHGHRYAVAWPSLHPSGGEYRWRMPSGRMADEGEVPRVADLPVLPAEWVAVLVDPKASGSTSRSSHAKGRVTPSTLRDLLAQTSDYEDGRSKAEHVARIHMSLDEHLLALGGRNEAVLRTAGFEGRIVLHEEAYPLAWLLDAIAEWLAERQGPPFPGPFTDEEMIRTVCSALGYAVADDNDEVEVRKAAAEVERRMTKLGLDIFDAVMTDSEVEAAADREGPEPTSPLNAPSPPQHEADGSSATREIEERLRAAEAAVSAASAADTASDDLEDALRIADTPGSDQVLDAIADRGSDNTVGQAEVDAGLAADGEAETGDDGGVAEDSDTELTDAVAAVADLMAGESSEAASEDDVNEMVAALGKLDTASPADVFSDVEESLIEREEQKLRIREKARERFNRKRQLELWEPVEAEDLTSFLSRDIPGAKYRIGSVWPAGGHVTLVAQAKAGKTLMTDNVVRSLADHTPFLGIYPVVPFEGRIGYVNLEVNDRQRQDWLKAAKIQNTDRIDVFNLRGRAHLMNPMLEGDAMQRLVEQIRARDIRILILDPVGAMLDAVGLSDTKNEEVGKFLAAWTRLCEAAGVEESLITHHAGHGQERARGATKWQDWPDAMWRLVIGATDTSRKDGDPDSLFADSARPDWSGNRYFSADGRDVQVPESKLTADVENRKLTITVEGAGRSTEKAKRTAAKRSAKVDDMAVDALRLIDEASGPMSTRELTEKLGGNRQARHDALDHALDLGWVAVTETTGRGGKRRVFELTDAGRETIEMSDVVESGLLGAIVTGDDLHDDD